MDRESNSVQNSLRSRPSPHLILGGTAAGAHQSHHGSRRTLQSSLDSSVCADNRSEITGTVLLSISSYLSGHFEFCNCLN